MAPDEPVVNHVGQATPDLERAVAFYTTVLGFVLSRRLSIPDQAASALLGVPEPVGLDVAYLTRGSFVLELMQFNRPGNPDWSERVFNEPGLTHLSISVPDIEATTQLAERHGAQVVRRLPVAVMMRDPDGQLVELLTMDYRRQIDSGPLSG